MQKNVNQSKTEDFRNDLCNAARQKKCFGFRVCVELTDTHYNNTIARGGGTSFFQVKLKKISPFF